MSAHILATRDGPYLVVGIMALMGAVCPQCGFGTRVTSKRWARCKKGCEGRIQRRTADEVQALLRELRDKQVPA